MLKAVSKISEETFPRKSVGFVNLMQDPKSNFGNSVTVEGRVRRCVPVQINDKELKALLGFETYYELDMFVPLGDQKIVVRTSSDSTLEYEQRFPVTACLPSLPAGMTASDIEDKLVQLDGFFYRFWKYQSEFTDRAEGKGSGQNQSADHGLHPTILSPSESSLDLFLYGISRCSCCRVSECCFG